MKQPKASLAYGFVIEPVDLGRIAGDYEDKVEGVLAFLLGAVKYGGAQSPEEVVLEKVGVRVRRWMIRDDEYVVVTSGEELHQVGWGIELINLPWDGTHGHRDARAMYASNLLAVDAEPTWMLRTDLS